MTIDEAVWKDVVDWEHLYEVSSAGHVRNKLTLQVLEVNAYGVVTLHYAGRKAEQRNPGYFVLYSFVGPKPPGTQLCHYDDNKTNNAIANIRWGTRRDNMEDAIRNGRQHLFDGMRDKAKLTEDEVREIRQLRADGWTLLQLSNAYFVAIATINKIVLNRTWRHLL